MNRRYFTTLLAAAPLSLAAAPDSQFKIFRRDRLPDPVKIATLELLRSGDHYLARARSTDGTEGWSVAHPSKARMSYPVFRDTIAPIFAGRDARDLESLIDEVYHRGSNYKMQGQLLWVQVAAAEFAVLDLLGKASGQSAVDLLGGPVRTTVPLYVANNHRHLDADASLAKIVESVERTGCRAVKYKLGGRMQNADQIPGRTPALIPKVSAALADRCTIYADANSSYTDVAEAIRIGRLLEENDVAFYEEPVPFDWLDETRQVAAALDIPIAWGEQESSAWRFRHLIETGGVQVPQPDLFYYGGLIRSLRVARLAAAHGLDCTPHISGGGLGFLYTQIYAAVCENAGVFQEYKGLGGVGWESTGEPMILENGEMGVPTGPGLGVAIDPDLLAKAELV